MAAVAPGGLPRLRATAAGEPCRVPVYDPAMDTASQTTWRPQAFGHRNAKDVIDPVIEPMWRGDRVIVTVTQRGVDIFDTEGAAVTDGVDEIVAQVRRAILADHAVLDGYLTRQATPAPGILRNVGPKIPTAGQMTSQMLVGSGIRAKAMTRLDSDEPDLDRDNPLALVAVDLLEVDGQELLDIPLLERKRHLESAVQESDLVRRGAYVRPPVDTWLASWRALGFRELAYKAANSRYLPGAVNDAWAIVRIPTT
jgi:ATP-dependent DNA ligase